MSNLPDLIYGPQTPAVQALISRANRLTFSEFTRLADAWAARAATGDARDAAWAATGVARDAAWAATGDARDAAWAATGDARDAAWAAARDAARSSAKNVVRKSTRKSTRTTALAVIVDAVLALVVRDLIPDDVYRTLIGPWAEVIGPAHPDDPDCRQNEHTYEFDPQEES
jgi:hypothetical protein